MKSIERQFTTPTLNPKVCTDCIDGCNRRPHQASIQVVALGESVGHASRKCWNWAGKHDMREPCKHDANYPVYISSYFSLGDAHCTTLYTFLSIFINELVHKLILLLFYARFLLILASTALQRIQFLLPLFQVYLFAFPQSFGT
jgi:hypothetical protein